MTTCKDLVDITTKYKECFSKSGLTIKVMPLNSGNKNPKFKHRGGTYNDMAHVLKEEAWIDKDRKLCNYGWMLNEQVFCVDLDGFGDTEELKRESANEYFQMISEKFPDDVQNALIETTKKGYHLIWKRTEKLNGLTDHTDAFRHNNLRGIDIKTITNAIHDGVRTQSILAVYPSNGKKWMQGHNPLEGALIQECSDEFAEWILKNMSKPQKETVKKSTVKKEIKTKERQDIEELKRLLPLLTEEFYEKVSDGGSWDLWMKVSRGIINICGPTSEAYDLFVQHSSRSSSFDEDANKRYWEKFITDDPVDEPIGIGSFRSWTRTAPPDGDFLDVCEKFEKEHAKIINKSVFVKLIGDDSYQFFSLAELRASYEHLIYINAEGKETPFLKKWLTYPKMRCYEDVVNEPPGVKYHANQLNLWVPFPPEKIFAWKHNEEGLQFLLNHIKILCNHDEKVYSYFIMYIGHMIVYAYEKSKCVTFISKQGAGKGSLLYLFGKLLGTSRVLKTSFPSRDCWGMFNGPMANAFLVNLDELSKKETIDAEGQIKALVTDDTLMINNKGKGQYTTKSYHRFIITTNNEDPIKTSSDDRRNLIIRSSDELCPKICGEEKSAKYFEILRGYMNDPDVIKTIYEYFKNLPGLDKFNHIPIPTTEHQENLKELSKTPIECWLEYFVANSSDDEVIIATSDLYQDFCSWNSMFNKDYKVPNTQSFGVRLSNLKMPEITTKLTNACSKRVFDIKALRVRFGLIDINEAQI